MNTKLFFSCLMITFGMLFWMFFQTGSLTFIGIRVAIAFVSAIIMLFSVTWNDKKRWGKTSLIILSVLLLGTAVYIAFNWGIVNYPIATMATITSLVVGILLYIKYIEPKIIKSEQKVNEATELKIKIEEVPNNDILIYHISDVLSEMKWSFESKEDLQYGGLHSINFEKVEVPEELQYLAGAFLVTVDGLMRVDFSKYEIRFEKSPVFDWKDMEKEILPIINKMVAKKRKMVIKERVRMSINEKGCAVYTKVH